MSHWVDLGLLTDPREPVLADPTPSFVCSGCGSKDRPHASHGRCKTCDSRERRGIPLDGILICQGCGREYRMGRGVSPSRCARCLQAHRVSTKAREGEG